jgi:hypothetical protein
MDLSILDRLFCLVVLSIAHMKDDAVKRKIYASISDPKHKESEK